MVLTQLNSLMGLLIEGWRWHYTLSIFLGSLNINCSLVVILMTSINLINSGLDFDVISLGSPVIQLIRMRKSSFLTICQISYMWHSFTTSVVIFKKTVWTNIHVSPPARWGPLEFNKGATPSSLLLLLLFPPTLPLSRTFSPLFLACSSCSSSWRGFQLLWTVSRAPDAVEDVWTRTPYRELRMLWYTPGPEPYCELAVPNLIWIAVVPYR